MNRFLIGLAIVILVLAFTHTGFAQSSGGITVQWGDDSKQGPSNGSYKKKGGPPPHAPAHGYPGRNKSKL